MIIAKERPEQLEGLDWGQDELDEKIDWYLQQLNRDLPDNDDDRFWVHCDDKQRREMNQRLALCRIRAHEIKDECREIDVANLKAIYPPNVLEDNGYFKSYEHKFDWYFDPQYCNYARFQDYQRLMLRNNMNFKEALKEVYYEGKYTLFRFEWKSEFENDDPTPGPVEHLVCHPSSKMLKRRCCLSVDHGSCQKICSKTEDILRLCRKEVGHCKRNRLDPLQPLQKFYVTEQFRGHRLTAHEAGVSPVIAM
ncbi:hypothetical protein PAHAL_9G041400 [Panicum hallii]|uniref:Uncharacterized protein n=1 Tax=Panicum hallii TaxID=206008 RepID=A0A2S3IH31_9POAL|nr:hypothetical protein PAHAL_9G041400 [Panicum hallii]